MAKILHRYEWVAAFADTDAGGVVYHARYLEFFERARFDLFQKLDPGAVLPNLERGGYVVSDVHVKFKRPARLGDTILIETMLQEIKRASFTLSHRARHRTTGVVFSEAAVEIVHVDKRFKPAALAEGLVRGLKKSD